ncbi:class I SAM-dependent DNA methyltransferase [Variovorax sp. RCC_210]|uniref:class I SAM-dependent DNA methyltransferase n=1 Tax=Variovorax sp. RCC_210 TaxID=3239217 RepID=UPI003526824F
MNAVEIEQAFSELALQPFDSAEFPYSFLAAFGNKDTTLKRLRTGNNNASDVAGGVLLRNNIHLAVCAVGTVGNTLRALRASPATTKAKAKFILATDGQTLEAEELISGETIASLFPDFPNHFGFLLPLAGISTIKEIKDNPIDVRATGRLNKLYVELLRENPAWATDERRSDMNHFMARLVFCFFAEDTDIFNGKGLFTHTVDQMSASDGSNTHEVLSEIFRAMNIKVGDRATGVPRLPNWANGFPYVNGGLFSGSTEVPRFTRMARTYLMHAGALTWREINPDIFGSMIQAVADDEERGALGMHYTSVPNILKVLNPLFLDDLRAALAEAAENERKLLNLRKRMSRIRVFDPACGSGNFLVIAYKQMREIESEINRRRGELHLGSEIPLTNFRGIELRDFPAEIARLALIIAEFQCDVLYRGQKDALAEFLPLDAQNWIVCGNALRLDWLSVCPPTGMGVRVMADDLFEAPHNQAEIDFENEGGETYICGNPPYLGYKFQSAAQKADVSAVFGARTKASRSLDFVTAWLMKAADYGEQSPSAAAFVTTNSICQGQQVPILWPLIFDTGNRISFAHTSFKWSNLASHNAGVTVAIVGIALEGSIKNRRIFSEANGQLLESTVQNINPYLVNSRDIFVKSRDQQLSKLAEMLSGDKLTDGGNLVLSGEERHRLLKSAPHAARYLSRLVGGQELIRGILRYALLVPDEEVAVAERLPGIATRLRAVSAMRAASTKAATQALASMPHRFDESRFEPCRKIVVAQLSSENRHYYPCDLVGESDIAMAPSLVIYQDDLHLLSLIVSRLHLIWIATVCGKLETRYRYSNTLGWNTFPVPLLTQQNKADLAQCAEDILVAREAHFPATIADLYDPETMPENLRHAHERNDEVLERIYVGRRFKNDTERLEKLFELYTKMTAAEKAKPAAKAAKGRNKTS